MTAPEDLPIASEDAIDHWKRITDSPGYGPVVAWSEAQRRNVPHLSGDEIRHHHQTDTLLIRVAQVIVGIYDVDRARRDVRQRVRGDP